MPPLTRLVLFLAEDKGDLLLLLIYTSISSLLSLSIPLAAQALINTIASGLFLQPLVILTTLVFLGLSFNGLIRSLEIYMIEIIQQRIFARIALRLARHIPSTRLDAFGQSYPPELVNRFFDTITTQKVISKLFLDVPNALLQGTLAFIIMAFYSPFLLAFNTLVIVAIFVIVILGWGALRTSIDESTSKYRVAHWLEELARCQLSFKINSNSRFSLVEANEKVQEYVTRRQKHFKIVFRQRISGLIFYALGSSGVLALGGWLVLEQQLTLGQLVAAELMSIILLNAIDKILSFLEGFYDLQTSMSKLGVLFDLEEESSGKANFSATTPTASVEFRHVNFEYRNGKQVFKDLSLFIPAQAKVSIVGQSGSGKSTLGLLIAGLHTPSFGNITINNMDLRDIDLNSYRDNFSLVTTGNDLFEGTLENNIRMNRSQVKPGDVLWALEMVELAQELPELENGLQTRVVSGGQNLSEGVRQRILLARALVEKPALMILDEALNGIDEARKLRILDRLMAPDAPWTLIQMTHDLDVIARSQQIYLLDNGGIREAGDPWALANDPASLFKRYFPKLSLLMQRTPSNLYLAPVEEEAS